MPSCVFNNILASFVLFLYFLRFPVIALAGTTSPSLSSACAGSGLRQFVRTSTIMVGYHRSLHLSREKCERSVRQEGFRNSRHDERLEGQPSWWPARGHQGGPCVILLHLRGRCSGYPMNSLRGTPAKRGALRRPRALLLSRRLGKMTMDR